MRGRTPRSCISRTRRRARIAARSWSATAPATSASTAAPRADARRRERNVATKGGRWAAFFCSLSRRGGLTLTRMRVRDVMRKEVRTIQPTEPASAAKELLRRYDIHHLVVVDKKNVVGVVADRDLMDVDADTAVQRAMAHPPVTITPDETVRKAAALMTGHVIGS